jgi:hypothetical protein
MTFRKTIEENFSLNLVKEQRGYEGGEKEQSPQCGPVIPWQIWEKLHISSIQIKLLS